MFVNSDKYDADCQFNINPMTLSKTRIDQFLPNMAEDVKTALSMGHVLAISVVDLCCLVLNIHLVISIKLGKSNLNVVERMQVFKTCLAIASCLIFIPLDLHCTRIISTSDLVTAFRDISEDILFHALVAIFFAMAVVRRLVVRCRGNAAILIRGKHALLAITSSMLPAFVCAVFHLPWGTHLKSRDTYANSTDQSSADDDFVKLEWFNITAFSISVVLPLCCACVIYGFVYHALWNCQPMRIWSVTGQPSSRMPVRIISQRSQTTSMKTSITVAVVSMLIPWLLYIVFKIFYYLPHNEIFTLYPQILIYTKVIILLIHPFGEGIALQTKRDNLRRFYKSHPFNSFRFSADFEIRLPRMSRVENNHTNRIGDADIWPNDPTSEFNLNNCKEQNVNRNGHSTVSTSKEQEISLPTMLKQASQQNSQLSSKMVRRSGRTLLNCLAVENNQIAKFEDSRGPPFDETIKETGRQKHADTEKQISTISGDFSSLISPYNSSGVSDRLEMQSALKVSPNDWDIDNSSFNVCSSLDKTKGNLQNLDAEASLSTANVVDVKDITDATLLEEDVHFSGIEDQSQQVENKHGMRASRFSSTSKGVWKQSRENKTDGTFHNVRGRFSEVAFQTVVDPVRNTHGRHYSQASSHPKGLQRITFSDGEPTGANKEKLFTRKWPKITIEEYSHEGQFDRLKNKRSPVSFPKSSTSPDDTESSARKTDCCPRSILSVEIPSSSASPQENLRISGNTGFISPVDFF